MTRSPLLPAACALLLLAAAAPAIAQDRHPQDQRASSWSQVKCERYAKAWRDTLSRRGVKGLAPSFIASHEAFLASGCLAKGDVCPRSAEELDLANVMVILAMNAGTASTFLPFACPSPARRAP